MSPRRFTILKLLVLWFFFTTLSACAASYRQPDGLAALDEIQREWETSPEFGFEGYCPTPERALSVYGYNIYQIVGYYKEGNLKVYRAKLDMLAKKSFIKNVSISNPRLDTAVDLFMVKSTSKPHAEALLDLQNTAADAILDATLDDKFRREATYLLLGLLSNKILLFINDDEFMPLNEHFFHILDGGLAAFGTEKLHGAFKDSWRKASKHHDDRTRRTKLSLEKSLNTLFYIDQVKCKKASRNRPAPKPRTDIRISEVNIKHTGGQGGATKSEQFDTSAETSHHTIAVEVRVIGEPGPNEVLVANKPALQGIDIEKWYVTLDLDDPDTLRAIDSAGGIEIVAKRDGLTRRSFERFSIEQSPEPGRKIALLVASNGYESWPPLYNTHRDVRAIGKVLSEVYHFDHVELLFDPTRPQLDAKLEALSTGASVKNLKREFVGSKRVDRIERGDTFVLMISGHGFYDESDINHRGYTVTVEAPPSKGKRHHLYKEHRELMDDLNNIKAQHTLVILDVCHGGTLFENMRSEPRKKKREVLLELQRQSKSRFVITSVGRGEARDGVRGKNSPFAIALLDTLTGESLLEDGILTDRELAKGLEDAGWSNPNDPPRSGHVGSEPGAIFMLRTY